MSYPQQPAPHQPPHLPQHPFGTAPLNPEAERLNHSRRRYLGSGVAWLVMSALNLGWPLVMGALTLLGLMVGFGWSSATGDVDGFFGGATVLLVIALIYLGTFPLLMVLTLLTALRSHWLHGRLRPFGRSAKAGIIVGWIGFGLATVNVVTVASTFSSIFFAF